MLFGDGIRKYRIFSCVLVAKMEKFCYNKFTMSDLTKILLPLTFTNTPFTKESYDMYTYHKHESLEIVYIASGCIQMSYYRKPGEQPKSITLHENQFMIIKPGIKHFQAVTNSAHMMVLELGHASSHVPVDTFIAGSDFISLIDGAKQFILKADVVSVFTDIHDVKRVLGKVLTLLYNHQHGKSDEFFASHYEIYLKQLAVEIFKCINTKTDFKYNRYIQYVLSFIQKNYGMPITVKQISENLELSSTYLNSIFKKDLGQTIQEYLISVRIENAKKLLQEQTLSVSAVGKKVGYQSLRSFETAFLQRVGVSPTQYQKQQKLDGFMLWKNHQDGTVAVDRPLPHKDKK